MRSSRCWGEVVSCSEMSSAPKKMPGVLCATRDLFLIGDAPKHRKPRRRLARIC